MSRGSHRRCMREVEAAAAHPGYSALGFLLAVITALLRVIGNGRVTTTVEDTIKRNLGIVLYEHISKEGEDGTVGTYPNRNSDRNSTDDTSRED